MCIAYNHHKFKFVFEKFEAQGVAGRELLYKHVINTMTFFLEQECILN
jgi:hypothetical protein